MSTFDDAAAESWVEVRISVKYGRNSTGLTGRLYSDLEATVAALKARIERDTMGPVDVTKVETREVVCTMWELR